MYRKVQILKTGRERVDNYIKMHCQGISQQQCAAKLQRSDATSAIVAETLVGFTVAGVVVDIKDLMQAETGSEYAQAILGIVLPGIGDSVKSYLKLKRTEDALKTVKVLEESAALNRIGKNPTGPNLVNKKIETVLNIQASKRVSRVTAPIDFDKHILNTEISKRGKLTGGHSTANGNVNVVSRGESNALGVYEAKISYTNPATGRTLTKNSTMFPDNWSADRIKVEVDAAYQNKTTFINNRGQEMWKGTTPSGVTVEGYVRPKATVFPKMGESK